MIEELKEVAGRACQLLLEGRDGDLGACSKVADFEEAADRACQLLLEGRDPASRACQGVEGLEQAAYGACTSLPDADYGGACTRLLVSVFTIAGCLPDAGCAGSEVIEAVARAIEENGVPPVVTGPIISISDAPAVNENSGAPASFTLTLSDLSAHPVLVRYALVEGSAKFVNPNGQPPDFLRYSGQIMIPQGQTSVTFGVKVLDDAIAGEGSEDFFAQLLLPVNGTLGPITRAAATIVDDIGG